VSAGEAWLPKLTVLERLRHFVETVSTRLEQEGINDTTMQAEWREIGSLDPEEQEYFEAAARLGIDAAAPNANETALRSMVAAADTVDRTLLDDLLDAVSERDLVRSAEWTQAASEEYDRASREADSVLPDVHAASLSPARPWIAGYTDAAQIREAIGLRPEEPFPIESYIDAQPVATDQEHVQGLTGRSKPVVVHTRHTESGNRFTSARALWYYAFGMQDYALITDAHTSRQRRGRAFAAELLAPAAGIRLELGDGSDVVVSESTVNRIAEHFRVSPYVVDHQIYNQLGQQIAHYG
jgi:hypothetical protein